MPNAERPKPETPKPTNVHPPSQVSHAHPARLKPVSPYTTWPDGPCTHPGCFGHTTHPCEGCGRIAGYMAVYTIADVQDLTRRIQDLEVLLAKAKNPV